MTRLRSDHVTLRYGTRKVVFDLDLEIPDGQITTIIGPNGCGKSTLLRALARMLRPAGGSIVLDGQMIHHYPTRDVARQLGLLSQQSASIAGIKVEDLVRRGRYPHQSFLQPPSRRDAEAVENALDLTNMMELRDRAVDELSGGQRQRAWIAMAIAQDTPLLLLDEPTTYLDLPHQLEITELVQRLQQVEGRTIVMVLHDVNEAARASHRMVAMRDGRIHAEGTPDEIVTPELLSELYGVACDVYRHPTLGHPYCVPRSEEICTCDPHPGTGDGFAVKSVRTSYGKVNVLNDLSLDLPAGKVTAVIGPNACGKSTLIRTCARLMRPVNGAVHLGDAAVHRGPHRLLARKLSLLAQGPVPPSGYLVEDLVSAGRTPHQGWLKQWRKDDESKVNDAIDRCHLEELRYRDLDTLSGGQRQRAWFAMCLAQDTPVLLLDEPTTFLDIAAQIEMLNLAHALNREEGRTIVMILHDLNLAARYADWIVAMKDGEIASAGTPEAVITPGLLRDVFEVEATVITDPRTGRPLVIPNAALSTHRHGPLGDDTVIAV